VKRTTRALVAVRAGVDAGVPRASAGSDRNGCMGPPHWTRSDEPVDPLRACWLGFTALLLALAPIFDGERPDGVRIAVLVVATLPVAVLLPSLDSRRDE
jgi:hypothetical protein